MGKSVAREPSFDGYLVSGMFFVLLLLIGLGGWAAYASISGAVIAQGIVAVEGKSKTIQHLDGGVIGQLLVRDGDLVASGDVLITLDKTVLTAQLAAVEARLYEALALKDRLLAEREDSTNYLPSVEFKEAIEKPEVRRIIEGQRKLLTARRTTREGQITQLRRRIVQNQDQIDGIMAVRASKAKQLELISRELTGLQKLHEKGHVPITRILALQRESARLEGELASHRADIARIKNASGETEIQILQITRDFREKVLTQLRETSAQVRVLSEQRIAALEKLRRIEIRAPVAGIVHGLSLHTIGGVISPASPIMQIIPVKDRLIVESRVEPHHIDQISIGRKAYVRLSAFNQRTTPELTGTVIKVSADRLEDKTNGAAYYEVKIEIPKTELAPLKDLTLRPGMPVESYIQTGERTALGFFLKPLTDQIYRAFREE